MSEAEAAVVAKPKAIECRFAVYAKSTAEGDYRDIHLIKEQVHNEDGTITPNVRVVTNYERPFWVTKKGMQNHKDKKEWERKENVLEFKSTQTQLGQAVGKALGKAWFKGGLRELAESPYLYGTDILSTSIIKQSYKDRWDLQTPYSVAVYDTETDVVHGTGQIMMATVSFKERVFTAVQKSFVAGYPNPIEKIRTIAERLLGDVLKRRNITLDIVIVDDEISVVKTTVAKCHEWRPDLLTAWNLAFDMDKIVEACDRAGVRPEDILSDPAVPNEFKSFRFKKGPAKKTTASGRVMNFKPAQRWHTVFCPSSFYWVDSMCIYKQVRISQPEESSYGLDYILKKNKLGGKLKFTEAEHLEGNGLEWHKFMQSRYPLEYVVYNLWDCISVEELDEKTLDLQLSLPMFAGCTDFQHFNSQPKRAVNELHFFCMQNNRVIGTTASEMSNEMDEETASLDGWIVMLPSHLVADNGLQIILEHPELRTNIRAHVGDLDVAASYPNGECVFNISKETTSKELLSIEGIDETTQRMGTINLSAGRTNAVEICTTLYSMPTFDMLLDAFQALDHATPVEHLMVPADEPHAALPPPAVGEVIVANLDITVDVDVYTLRADQIVEVVEEARMDQEQAVAQAPEVIEVY